MAEIVKASDLKIELDKLEKVEGFRAFTGFEKLDEATKGFRGGQLVIISGPTGGGKTAISRTFTQKLIEHQTKVCWFSYEESYEDLFEKMPSLDFYVPDKREDDQLEWLKKHMQKAKEHGVTVFFIDNLDFLRKPKDLKMPDMNLASYVGGIVQDIKTFAVQENVIIFLLVHIKKNNWSSNEMPTSEDIRDSGMVPQLADFVFFIKRERNDEKIPTAFARLSIDKNRVNGRCIILDLVYSESDKMYRETTGQDMLNIASKTAEMPDWSQPLPFNKKRV